MSETLTVTPSPAKVGDSLVITAAGIGNPVKALLDVNPAGANNALTYTAVTPGTAGNSITVKYTDPAGNDQPLSVAVVGNDIEVLLATGPAGAITSTAAQIAAAVQASLPASALVTVANTAANDGTGVVAAVAKTNLATGANASGVTTVQVRVGYRGGSDETIVETMTLAAAGTINSAGDFTFEADQDGVVEAVLLVDGVVKATVPVQVFTS